MTWLIWLVIVGVFVLRGLVNAAKSERGSSWRPRSRRDGSTPNVEPMRQPTAQPTNQSTNQPWLQPGWQPQPWADNVPVPNGPHVPIAPGTAQPGWAASEPGWPLPAPDRAEAQSAPEPLAAMAAEVAAAVAAQPPAASAPPGPATPAPRPDTPRRTERYVGSAALESTLDSTIESSLLGFTPGPLLASALPGGATVALPEEVGAQVRMLIAAGHEVAAVRLVCDELGVGILDALRSVRAVDDLPSV